MGVGKELFELGFKKISKATMNFLETGVPRTDHAGIIRAATNSPQELTEYIRHADNFVKKKDQSGILPMIQYSDKWNNEVVEATKQADTLSLGTTPAAQQDALYKPQDTSGIAGRGEPFRAHKATSREGAKSIIAGTPNTIISKEPQNTEKAMAWARGAYEYARSGKSGNKAQPLKGYPRYVGEDGTLYKPRPNVGRKGGYQLKFQSMDLLKGYDDLRKMREAPWRKQEVIDQLQAILENQGKGDKLDKLLKIMLNDYNTKLKGIKAAKQTKGHFISLDKGGLDVAENFGPQKGKSTKNPKTGEWEMGNYAEKADSSIPEGTNVPTTWEEYVALKLPLLK